MMSALTRAMACAAVLVVLAVGTYADTPANCTYEDARGTWVFEVGPSLKEGSSEIINCSAVMETGFTSQYKVQVHLDSPDVATDEFNNKGFWTIIYNQGFEVVVGGRKYFGYFAYKGNVSICDKLIAGWAHDVMGHDRRCFKGYRSQPSIKHSSRVGQDASLRFEPSLNTEEAVAFINKAQNSWTATRYSRFDGISREDFIKMAGGRRSRIASRPKPAPISEEQERLRQSLPRSFDWRNVAGENFVSPVRDQRTCGSCYAFSSMGMAEARVRIQTNNTQQPVFSPQDIVECSPYSQGCVGGFPYLIGGKYSEDFGLVEEKCNKYTGKDGKCTTDKTCARHYLTDYKYVGGYYGACNEVAMMEAIYKRGPVMVGFEAYHDFLSYKSGVYHHVFEENLDKFEPFELTNHAVLVVGWGEAASPAAERYWIVKNSWSTLWGLDGYFWIRRGNDECGIESMAAEATPILRFD